MEVFGVAAAGESQPEAQQDMVLDLLSSVLQKLHSHNEVSAIVRVGLMCTFRMARSSATCGAFWASLLHSVPSHSCARLASSRRWSPSRLRARGACPSGACRRIAADCGRSRKLLDYVIKAVLHCTSSRARAHLYAVLHFAVQVRHGSRDLL
jgi:hypothetical protein